MNCNLGVRILYIILSFPHNIVVDLIGFMVVGCHKKVYLLMGHFFWNEG